MKRLTENGNVIPLFSTAAAAAKAREILGTRGEDGELLYIDKGNWNPFKGTSVGIPSDVLSTIQSNLYAETGAVPPDTTSEASSVTEKVPAITQEEYNALKPGMEYTAPDGSKRTKK